MAESITITLPREIRDALDEVVRKEGVRADALIGQAIKEHLFVRQFRSLRERLAANARSQGIVTDDDVFNRVS